MLKIIKKSLILMISIFILLISVLAYSYFIEPNRLIIKNYNIFTNENIQEFKIVFFSDTHFGKLYNQKNIEKIVDKINNQNPDLVIFGGDFLDNYAKDKEILDLEYLKTHLKNINSKYGNFAIWGNHDYGGGSVKIYKDFMETSNFKIIKNNNEFIPELNIRLIGFDDLLMGYTDPSLYNIKSTHFNIILSHEPDVAKNIYTTSENIMLSGHSHGGQIFVPILSKYALPKGSKTYTKGIYKNISKNKNLDLIVSKGIGMTIFPLRFLNTPEIVTINVNKLTIP